MDALAADEATFEEAVAPAAEAWQIATAQAAHDYTEAVAAAQYSVTTGGITPDE